MTTITEAAETFLASKRIAITGVSRDPKGHGGNIVYQRLRERGYEVYPINPNADEVEGDRCYHHLKDVPGGVDAVVIGTSPSHASETMQEIVDLGIRQAWMHRSFGGGSVSIDAVDYGREHGVTVIDGGCPLMFGPTADGGHKVIKFFCTLAGTVPRTVGNGSADVA